MLTKIKQNFSNECLADVKGKCAEELLRLGHFIKPGNRIGIAIGSRGIKDLLLLVQETVEFIRKKEAFPFIVPSMGSHGGATDEGQREVLAGYGISEETLGVKILSSMEVAELPRGDSPVPVYMDRNAFGSDGVILINRIKLHTDYHSTYESGMVKMSVIGLGKERQASSIHEYGVFGLSELIPVVAKEIFRSGKIIGGLAVVENAYDNTMVLKALRTDEFFEKEPELLGIAKVNMPSLPADEIDVLIIDRLGKDISGVGIDPNIIGRTRIRGQEEPIRPGVKAIMVTDLTDATHGNAMGIGLADVTTRKLFNRIDFGITYKNIITSSFLERGKIPIVAETEREAFEIALRSCGHIRKGDERIVRIKDTLHLGEVYVSRAILDEIGNSNRIEILKEDVRQFEDSNEIAVF